MSDDKGEYVRQDVPMLFCEQCSTDGTKTPFYIDAYPTGREQKVWTRITCSRCSAGILLLGWFGTKQLEEE